MGRYPVFQYMDPVGVWRSLNVPSTRHTIHKLAFADAAEGPLEADTKQPIDGSLAHDLPVPLVSRLDARWHYG